MHSKNEIIIFKITKISLYYQGWICIIKLETTIKNFELRPSQEKVPLTFLQINHIHTKKIKSTTYSNCRFFHTEKVLLVLKVLESKLLIRYYMG